jgi:hypothetical protein
MRKFFLAIGVMLVSLVPAFAVTVNVSTPVPYATVTSPATVKASASSTKPITGWHIYVDNKYVYGGNSTATSISPALTLTTGTHTVAVRAWDSTGAYGTNTFQVTVNGTAPTPPPPTSNAGPVAPANARVFSKIEQMSGWGACATAACAGTNGGVYWTAQNITTPSLDGSSTEFYAGGGPYADMLHWKNLGVSLTTTKFLYDVWFYVDNMAVAGALEFDYLQVVKGKKYNFSSQCDYYYGNHWDVWDGTGKHWVHTNMPCPKFTANTWHHYKMYGEIIPSTGQTHYFNIWVDGVDSMPNSTYAYQKAENTNWPNNATVQIQEDLTSKPGNGLHQWVDKVTLSVW